MKNKGVKIATLMLAFVFLLSSVFINPSAFVVSAISQVSNNEDLEDKEEMQTEEEQEKQEQQEEEKEQQQQEELEIETHGEKIETHFEHSNIEKYMQDPADRVEEALSDYNEIDEYFKQLSVPVTDINVNAEKQTYTDLVNDEEIGTGKLEKNYSISITKSEPDTDEDYKETLEKNKNWLPAFSNVVYPGQFIKINNSLYTETVSELTSLKGYRTTGNYKTSGASSKKFALENVSKTNMESKLRKKFDRIDNLQKEVKSSQVTSVEQTALELGVPEKKIRELLEDLKDDIRIGKKQVAIALVKEVVGTVSYDENLSLPSKFFDSENIPPIEKVKKVFSLKHPGSIVRDVEYGMAQLVLAEVNTDTAYNPKAENGFVDTADLEGALKKHFLNEPLNKRQENSLNAARLSYMTIGGTSSIWGDIERSDDDDTIRINEIDEIIPKEYNNVANAYKYNHIVPLNYTAYTLGSENRSISLKTNAPKYNFYRVEGRDIKINGVLGHPGGGMTCYGIDKDKYYNEMVISEKETVTDLGVHAFSTKKFSAFKGIFGCRVSYSRFFGIKQEEVVTDRIVQGGFYTAYFGGVEKWDGKTEPLLQTNVPRDEEKVIVGPFDWKRMRVTNRSFLRRVWELNLDGNALKYIND